MMTPQSIAPRRIMRDLCVDCGKPDSLAIVFPVNEELRRVYLCWRCTNNRVCESLAAQYLRGEL